MQGSTESDGFTVEGILVAAHPGQVRIILDDLVLDFDEDDVLETTVLDPLPLLDDAMAQPVRMVFRRPSRLMGVGSARIYEERIWRRGQLFALSTRRNEPHTPYENKRFADQERVFFERFGIQRSRPEAKD